jgi:RNA polymerase sigma-70 factor (ECF subfamily)
VIDPRPSSQSPLVEAAPAEIAAPQRFSDVYRAEFAFVVNSLRRLGIAPADLEDLTHDVFMTALRRREAYDPARPIRPWLFGIAFRLASDFRKLVRHTRESPLDHATGASEPVAGGGAPDENAAQRQDQQLVMDALARIDLSRRAVFVMHDIEDAAIPEIAAALESPLGTAYARLRQARIEFSEAVRALRKEGGT